ncbi:DUF4365 domain-containing protein [Blastopirellula marina]|uniref:DUF4365 domain-containing protein n=1 Tax=Blastopirellula marina TaxID=124 RepID=A0A2S8GP13_9BACT|nr:DUF4365 domain-containing protein [Blastopirellula marina]PQO46165.1 hypothetical protein C5Y93_09245 [Blastopirellula marina]
MDLNARKEELSRAYVQAIAATAGYSWSKPSVDDDSIDLTLAQRGGNGTIRSPRLDIQLKCHAAETPTVDEISFPLKIKNYDDLRAENVLIPRLLVVILIPHSPHEWLLQTESELAIKRCGYWVNLRGLPSTSNTKSVTISIPRRQQFTETGLRELMDKIGSGESL